VKGLRSTRLPWNPALYGRLEDLRLAAEVLKGSKVHEDVRLIVVLLPKNIYLDALKEGIIETFLEAGAIVCITWLRTLPGSPYGCLGPD
jgi:methanogen homoaconitase large subunit